jgi:2Fe-2S ferredoxin
MTKVTFIEFNGASHSLDVPDGHSLMQAAVRNGIDGIEAECGGSCACATCHCFIDPAFLPLLAPMADAENAMLDNTAVERQANSRLSCQVKVGPALEGLVVRLPERQS